MKLKNLILTGLLATAGYKLYKNRHQLVNQATDTRDLIGQTKDSFTAAQDQLQTLKAQAADLQTTKDNLTYKLRVFKEESQPHLEAIQTILAKHNQSNTTTK